MCRPWDDGRSFGDEAQSPWNVEACLACAEWVGSNSVEPGGPPTRHTQGMPLRSRGPERSDLELAGNINNCHIVTYISRNNSIRKNATIGQSEVPERDAWLKLSAHMCP